jgi:DNA-binding winged helix-turn-helix (wHTH) protein/Flp pilus assembly protein TadD
LKTPANKHERFQVGDLRLDSGTASLKREGDEIALPKLSFDLLLCLARHAPNVVSTDVLMNEVWGKVIVNDETVKQRVKLLRKALGDSSIDPRYISAVRGRGYRLLADVSPLADEAEVSSTSSASRGFRKILLVAVALLAIIGISFLMMTQHSKLETSNAQTGPESSKRGSTDNPEAWEAYTKGRAAYRRWTRQDNETALAFYLRAVELDPGFAMAIAGVANANALRATEFGLGAEWIDEAIRQARRALELEPELPEALKALGICYFYKGQYQTALDYNRSALRLDPEYDEVIFNIAEIMQLLGRWDEAVKYQRLDTRRAKGLEQLSIYLRDLGFDERAATLVQAFEQDLPVSFFSDANRSLHDLLNGDYEKARTAVRRIQRSFPNAALGWLREGEINLFAGDLESAVEDFQAARHTAGGFHDYAGLRVAHIQLLGGDRQSAESLLRQVEASALRAIRNGHEGWFHRWHLAFIHSLLGNQDEAVDWFEQAVNSGRRMYEWDELEPVFQPINDEPRFKAALQQQKDLRQKMKQHTAVLLEQ